MLMCQFLAMNEIIMYGKYVFLKVRKILITKNKKAASL